MRRRRVAAPRASATRVTPTTIAASRDECRVVAGDGAREAVVGPRQRQQHRDPLEHGRHLVPRHEQAAEEDLGQHERRHELDGLELALRERAREQPERDTQEGVEDCERDDDRDRALDVEPECAERDSRRHRRLHRSDERERDPVAGEQVELRERQRHQPLERSRRPLAQHRDRRDQEHDDEREEADERAADAVERLFLALEHVLEQRQQQRRHDQHQRDRPSVAAQLAQDAERGRPRDAALTPPPPTSRTLARGRRCRCGAAARRAPPCATIEPSRIMISSSQRSASSMT